MLPSWGIWTVLWWQNIGTDRSFWRWRWWWPSHKSSIFPSDSEQTRNGFIGRKKSWDFLFCWSSFPLPARDFTLKAPLAQLTDSRWGSRPSGKSRFERGGGGDGRVNRWRPKRRDLIWVELTMFKNYVIDLSYYVIDTEKKLCKKIQWIFHPFTIHR